ncbi:hypothetical protein TRICI_001161 [Trichomonascus ciferrii]|uniref:Palmitoyltransferase n=1 Tax=Trichomonascus ciferrii TaxID=44093 RepID=A0A642VA89_9ASCO|nr:hypothetical protein TRICI_001161 [Trichomonascus ciferrii]
MGLKGVLWLIIVFSILVLITLFGELPQFQGTWIARLRKVLFNVPRRVFGQYEDSIGVWWNRAEPYLRWTVPIGYLALVSGCIYVFLRDVYPEVERSDISSLQKRIIIPIVISLPYISATLAIFSDPGYIDGANHLRILQKFPYDGILFVPDNECVTCKRVKPPRSKHCRTCNMCIAMSDHHCVFINRCIGYYNIRWFLFFVSSNSILLGYGFYILRRNLAQLVHSMIWQGPRGFLNYKVWIEAVLQAKSNGALMFLCGTLFIVSTAFLCEHIKYIYLGVTTNETLKWEDINDCMDDGTLYFYDHPTIEERQQSHDLNEPSIVLQKLEHEEGFNRVLTEGEARRVQAQQLVLKPLTRFDQINNIYDRGFWQNLKDRLFPSQL